MSRKIIVKIVIMVLLFFSTISIAGVQAIEHEGELPFELESKGAILMDAYSGEILLSKNKHGKLYPASITKIMTMLLVMENIEEGRISLKDDVVISDTAAALGGSQIFLSPGDVVSLENLMIGVAVGSGNDAAVAVAEHSYGSVDVFVTKMNERAIALGKENTNFVNPHGLHDDNHYTTTYDVALMSRALLKHPQVHTWFKIWMNENFLENKIRSGGVFLSNTNRLIRYYEGADGLKTGFTSEAGHSVAATARRGETRFLAITLFAPSSAIRFDEAKKLLDYGFAGFESIFVAPAGEQLARVRVEKGKEIMLDLINEEDFRVLVPKGETPEFTKELQINENILAPINRGDLLGSMAVYQEGNLVGELKLVAEADVPRAGFTDLLKRVIIAWFQFGR